MQKLTVGSCFSGVGGLELGLEWTGGFKTVWQCEVDPYARRVLEKHWPRVERYTDITTVERPPRVDVICGGFPCQDVSLAGARAGLDGKRSTLWSELFRLVCEVKPRWLVAENVPGLLSSDGGRFMGNILRDLASIGFDAEWGVLSACAVGAPHTRERLFILAYPHSERLEGSRAFAANRKPLAPAELQSNAATAQIRRRVWSESPSSFVGMVDGFRDWKNRLRCLGNAVVPQVAQKIGEMILNFERAG